ncbi:MAG TPA: T9SS type A sorting domain-containing protein [Bacteroidia bacterium]|nr:T9SS type A sorting domain-containing protein [Bacteroidia bacterium]
MNRLRSLLIVLVCFVSHIPAFGSHLEGMYITYEKIPSGPGYTFNVKIYRDCEGIAVGPSLLIWFSSPSGCAPDFADTLYLNPATSGIQVPVNTCAPAGVSTCSGGTMYMFAEYNYSSGTINLPACSDWIVSTSSCCRSQYNGNLINGVQPEMYVETHLDNLHFPYNNSPVFNVNPVNYYCVGVPAMLDFSAFDVDGDSLSYEMAPVYAGTTGAAVINPYVPPYTVNQPLEVVNPLVLDPQTGQITFTPSMIQYSAFGFTVKEFRNGQLIGSVLRTDNVAVVSGTTGVDTITGRVYYDLNNNMVFDSLDIPANSMVVFPGVANQSAITTGAGKYEITVTAGNHALGVNNIPAYWTQAPSVLNVTTNGSGALYPNNDIALQTPIILNDLSITLNSVYPPHPGGSHALALNYKNEGTTQISNAEINLQLDPSLQFIVASYPPTSVNGNLLTWNFPTVPLFTNNIISVYSTIDSSTVIGDSLNNSATIDPVANDFTPANNSCMVSEMLDSTGSPNRMMVTPAGDIDLNFVASQQWLTYTVNFQNTGTGPVQTVTIDDGLDFDLDCSTIEVLASSFPCAVTFTPPNRLHFEFFGINLPSSALNEPASHGFVTYRIKPLAGTPAGTHIANSASVQFDAAAPGVTNLVITTVVTTTGIGEVNHTSSSLKIYPNPAHHRCTLELVSAVQGKSRLCIVNLPGKVVYTSEVYLTSGINELSIPLDDLANGIYFVELRQGTGTSVTKLVKN